MSTVSPDKWIEILEAGDKASLAISAVNCGYADGNKTAANLVLLYEALDDPDLVHRLLTIGLEAADPDLALNNLERLTGNIPVNLLAPVLHAPEASRQLLTLLGASPFLSGILYRDPVFFENLFIGEQLFSPKGEKTMLAELRHRIPDDAGFTELQKGLRLFKAAEILRIGGRDLCGLADLETTTLELSALAAASLQRAYEISVRLLAVDYGDPVVIDEAGEPTDELPEFTIFGMGKFGGRELNFSSDIDLIYFYRTDRGRTLGRPEATRGQKTQLTLHQYFVRLAEMISKAVGQATEDGFVFRVDLRLRPEGDSGEMANSLNAAEIYYESWGQSWERSAMLKARPVAGSIALGEEILERLQPFIYRRHLDYAMIEDIKVMKQKIDHSLARSREGDVNLKLGQGGIREIEFFIQALQLIHSGKIPKIRDRNSLKALTLLAEEGLITDEEQISLSEAYRFLRTAEHRIQVVHEQQTHNLPGRAVERLSLARRCGFESTEAFMAELGRHRENVSEIYHSLFYTSEEELPSQIKPEVNFLFDTDADPDLCMDILEEKGFRDPEAAYESLLVLRKGGIKGYMTESARRQLDRIAPLLFQEVLNSPDSEMALANLEKFLGACRRARGTFYALLAENPEIIKLLVSLFGTSQFLSRNFTQHPEVLDSLVSRVYATDDKTLETMTGELAERIRNAAHYEEKLEAIRRFRNEEFLRIALNDLHGHTPQGRTTHQLSLVADACLQNAQTIAREELIPRFGLPFCQDSADQSHEAAFGIIGLGKLGGMELNYHSDLDIIFLYEGEGETRPVEGTDPARFKPQSNQQYFARLAQRIISVLTLMTQEGYVYQIDTRLRPSGNQGPLVTSLPAYREYHESSAAPWERQALIKARVVSGTAELVENFDCLTAEIVYERPLPGNLVDEIYRLRQRMEKELGKESTESLNIKTGRGGMVDVEFLAQYLQLCHGRDFPAVRCRNTVDTLSALTREDLLPEADYDKLVDGYKFLRRLENKLRLIHDQSINELAADPDYLAKLARRLGYPDRPEQPEKLFLTEYELTTRGIREVFDRYISKPESD